VEIAVETPPIESILTCSHLEDDHATPWVPFEQSIALAKACAAVIWGEHPLGVSAE
jgi:hypothetical protein